VPLALALGLGMVALFMLSYGSALNSQNQAQANQDFWSWLAATALSPITWTIKESVHYAKVVAHWMYPGLKFAEQKVAGYFGALSKYGTYHANQAHRTIVALHNTVKYLTGPWAVAQAQAIKAKTKGELAHYFQGRAPTVPQRRINQKDIDAAFKRLIEANFARELNDKFPKWDWDPSQWKKWLGVLPGLAPALTPHGQPTTPPQPQPQPQPHTNPADNPATQPTTLPHTDDNPNPDPGVHVVPGVVPGKDKWARGQIVNLQKRHVGLLHKLSPLAFLAVPLAGITALEGLLRCRNFRRLQKPFCSIPTELVNWLLGAAAAALTAIELCNIALFAAEAATLALPALEELLLVEELVCAGGGATFPSAYLPGNFSSKIVPLSVV
jgi:hypothetical protein